MPFWEKLAPRERILVGIALGLTVFYLLYNYAIMPNWQKYQELKTELNTVNAEWERLQGIENVLATEVKNKEQLEKELKNIRAEFDFNVEDGAGFTKLLASAKEKNIRLLEFKPGSVVDKSYYFEFPVEIKVQGYYPQVLEYVESLENFPDLAEIKNLTISSVPGDVRGNVEAAFTLAIYSAKNPAGSLIIQNYEKLSTGKYNPFRPMYIPPVATTPATNNNPPGNNTGSGATVSGDIYNNNTDEEPLVK
ncbi:type IV pilus inner membrane component PilO [Carboxydothermus ferrireducens]|uniref:Type IV pilus assembly protein PilO n=1 Tax=Carboxydothermus ferrireducens DSM 11255 TaxID=1119529 RepID=A0ABX2R6C7_9THEO|nr:type 4a pilus biogenesis protein PilO [Carboxydothermus ferrireducens]NYE56514.1 type IV pilus assembly protein PilO [Carboxydothermus ferrireducens DSM 11255]